MDFNTLQSTLKELYYSFGGNADVVRNTNDINDIIYAIAALGVGAELVEALKREDLGASTYDAGTDLSYAFETEDDLHAAVAAGDFSKINIGDYYPITMKGDYKDFALYTVPSGTTYYSEAALTTEVAATTAALSGAYESATAVKIKIGSTDYYVAIEDCTEGYKKSIDETVYCEVAAINPYIGMGDTELTVPHVLFVSRDCLANTVQMRKANSVWTDPDAVNPWLGSAAYKTLNDGTNGIVKILENTPLGAHIFKGPNNKGMRAYLPKMAAGVSTPNGAEWNNRGLLFLPEEREVYGSIVWSNASGYNAGNLYNQWPIFAGTSRHIVKHAGDGGSLTRWWLESATSATNFSIVNNNGNANNNSAVTAYRVPLCFLYA